MTTQGIKPYVTDTNGCTECEHFDNSGVFELCQHPLSTYKVGAADDVHTVQHMREQSSACGLSRTHFMRKK